MNSILQQAIKLLEAASNIYNVDELKQKLSDLSQGTDNINTKKWINSNLKKYVLSTPELHNKVTRLPTNAPEWAHTALENNNLDEIDFNSHIWHEFEQDLEHAIVYLNTLGIQDISRVSVPDAIRLGNEYITRQEKLEQNYDKPDDVEVIYKHKDGYYWVKLITQNAFKLEGSRMQHCVGDASRYFELSQSGMGEIWSLRDQYDKPHCTIQYITAQKQITQVKGKQNQPVVEKYHRYVIEFLSVAHKHGIIRNFDAKDLINIGILDVNGTWYNVRSLPKNDITLLNYIIQNKSLLSELTGARNTVGIIPAVKTAIVGWISSFDIEVPTAEMAYNIALIKKSRFVEGERVILTNDWFSYLYARDVLKSPWPEAEQVISQNAGSAYLYARDVLNGKQFSQGENTIASNSMWAYSYARDVIKGRWATGEKIIATEARTAYLYAVDVLKGRFKLGERIIATDAEYAYYYAERVLKERFLEGETTIAQNIKYAYDYAKNIIKGRWVEAEPILVSQVEYAYKYARYVLKGKFELGEPKILKSVRYKDKYLASAGNNADKN